MRRTPLTPFWAILLCILMLCGCAADAADAVQDAAAADNAAPPEAAQAETLAQDASEEAENSSLNALLGGEAEPIPQGQLTGTVLYQDANTLAVNVGRTTFVFLTTLAAPDDYSPGDIVTVHYVGDSSLMPEALYIIRNGSAGAPNTAYGVVTKNEGWQLLVQSATGSVYGFSLTEDTIYNDTSKSTLKAGDVVMVNFEGSLVDLPITRAVSLLSPAAEGPMINRTLRGKVTALSDTAITITADDGNSYTFKRSASTQVVGSYALAVGATVRVTFDGYAALSPYAKSIDVLRPVPTPTPKATPLPTAKLVTPSPAKSTKATATPKPSATATTAPTLTTPPGSSSTPTPVPTPTPSGSVVTPTPTPSGSVVTPTPVPTPEPMPPVDTPEYVLRRINDRRAHENATRPGSGYTISPLEDNAAFRTKAQELAEYFMSDGVISDAYIQDAYEALGRNVQILQTTTNDPASLLTTWLNSTYVEPLLSYTTSSIGVGISRGSDGKLYYVVIVR